MTASGPKSLPSIGFLTVCEHAEHGLFGGYLLLNAAGRPLEFHCTAPVRPNRAQEILYGPTLRPFLYGEQIGQTLLAKAKVQPIFVCTDVEPALAVREFSSWPVLLVTAPAEDPAPAGNPTDSDQSAIQLRVDAAHVDASARKSARLLNFSLGEHQLAVLAAHEGDRQQATDLWGPYAHDFDLLEPFGRIREAIEEAQRSAKAG